MRVGDEHIAIDPTGGFDSAEDMLDLVIGSDRTGRQLFLRDVATIEAQLTRIRPVVCSGSTASPPSVWAFRRWRAATS